MCADFPDWSIAAAGFWERCQNWHDYRHLVTGKEQQIDLNEDDNQVVPDPLEERTMVATSADIYLWRIYFLLTVFHSVWLQAVELRLDAANLVDEAPSTFELISEEHGE